MAIVSRQTKVCDVFDTERGVSKYRVFVVKVENGDEAPPEFPKGTVNSYVRDLGKRGIKRLNHFIDRGLSKPKRPDRQLPLPGATEPTPEPAPQSKPRRRVAPQTT